MHMLDRFRQSRLVALFSLIIVVVPMLPIRALADTAPTSGASEVVQGQTGLGVDEGGGSNSGPLGAASIEPSTGTARASYAFALPSGRGDVQPTLGLSYSSSSGLGIGGQGWSLSLPSIQRQNLSGAPQFANDPQAAAPINPDKQDRFVFAGSSLIPICRVGSDLSCTGAAAGEQMPTWSALFHYYRLEREDGSLMRFFWSTSLDQWRVVTKAGTTMEFGRPSDTASVSDVDSLGAVDRDPATGATFRWNLARHYDTHRSASARAVNFIVYKWTQIANGGTPMGYLSDVFYTPPMTDAVPATSAFAHHVHLAMQPMGLHRLATQSPIWKLRPSEQLRRVDVTSHDFQGSAKRQQVRRYYLDYDYTLPNHPLKTVQAEGTARLPAQRPLEDGSQLLPDVTSVLRQQPTTYSYSAQAPAPSYPTLPSLTGTTGLSLQDINSDGLTDIVVQGSTLVSPTQPVFFNRSTTSGSSPWVPGAINFRPSQDVPGESVESFMPDSLPYQAGSFSNDGHMNVLWFGNIANYHTPNLAYYDLFSLVGSGTSWTWSSSSHMAQGNVPFFTLYQTAGNAVSSTGVAYISNEQKYATLDLNGDGFADMLTTAHYSPLPPQSNGFIGPRMFGARFTRVTPAGAIVAPFAIDPGFVATPLAIYPNTCVGGVNQDLEFFGPKVPLTFADFNGDGLPDLLKLTDTTVTAWVGRGDGVFGSCADGTTSCGCDKASGVDVSPGAVANLAQGHFADVTGDGRADLVVPAANSITVYPNNPLTGIGQGAITAAFARKGSKFYFADVNGSGVDDVIVGDSGAYTAVDVTGGTLPSLLTKIDNGLGGITTLTYDTIANLDAQATAAGQAWQTHSPQNLHVVTSITSGFAFPQGTSDLTSVTYTYRDPVYEPRERSFVGFRSVDAATLGDADAPTTHVTTQFYLRTCDGSAQWPCTQIDYLPASLRGVPTVTDVWGDVWENSRLKSALPTRLSTTHHGYIGHELYSGMDGRKVHLLTPRRTDTYTYDDSPFHAVDTAGPASYCDIIWGTGEASFCDSMQGAFMLHSDRYAHSVVLMMADAWGNSTETDDYGNVDPNAVDRSLDGIIRSKQMWTLIPGDLAHWTWRLTSASIDGLTAGSPDPIAPRSRTFSYNALGDLTDATAPLTGSLDLKRFHESGQPVADPPADRSSTSPTQVHYLHATFDKAGNMTQVVGPNGHCSSVTYDTAFSTLPTLREVFTGVVPCSGGALATLYSYDGARGQPTTIFAVDGSRVDYTLDEFGRTVSIAKPDPLNLGSTVAAATTVAYSEIPNQGTSVHSTTKDGTHTTETWVYLDGAGHKLASLTTAAAGDAGAWILSPRPGRNAHGSVSYAFPSVFFNGDARNPPLTVGTGPSRHVVRDAFGRLLAGFALDGTQTIRTTYGSSWATSYDAEQLRSVGPHVGGLVRTMFDGHGRQTSVVVGHSNGSALTTSFGYAPTGETTTIRRVTPEGAIYQRWMQYDSLGRLVQNIEPNTSTYPASAPSTFTGQAWRYAYNDAGNLVGTSDARGCGENRFYDGAGRLVAEDYSPCMASQQDYSKPTSAPSTLVMDGYEAFYTYDQLRGANGSVPGVTSLADGRLYDSYDRAQHSHVTYDGRGRVTAVTKALAVPGLPSPRVAGRYEAKTSSTTAVYDVLDRETGRTTGADVADLLVGGASSVTTTYTARGTVQSVQGSYGTLLAGATSDADGAPLTATFGDLAQTKATYGYDGRRRLFEFSLKRSAPALWSQPTTPTYAHATGADAPGTYATTLADDVYGYDAVGNPTTINDYRDWSEWPVGARPASRTATYDDDYRLNDLLFFYSAGDRYAAPAVASTTAASSPLPVTLPFTPSTKGATRIMTQSFRYDGLGNMTSSTDDAASFFDRSLGTIKNGVGTGLGPNQLLSASLPSPNGNGGHLTTRYDVAGNLVELAVVRNQVCVGSACSHIFRYEWDEVGRLAHARRYDFAYWEQDNLTPPADPPPECGLPGEPKCKPGIPVTPPPAPTARPAADPANNPARYTTPYPSTPPFAPAADITYKYDAGGSRVMREAHHGADTVYTAEIFASLRLEGTTWDGAQYKRDATTEAVSLVAGRGSYGRLLYASGLPSPTGTSLHVLLELGDSLGSTSTVIDKETSEVVEHTMFQAYGQVESDYRSARWESLRDPFKYTGKEDDVEMGLTYFGARYYAPQLARWLSADPLTVHGAGADLNPYAFVGGSPLRNVDPTGLDGCDKDGPTCTGKKSPVQGDPEGWKNAFAKAWNWTENAAGSVAHGVADVGDFIADEVGDLGHDVKCLVGGCIKVTVTPTGPPPPPVSSSPPTMAVQPMPPILSTADVWKSVNWWRASDPGGAGYQAVDHVQTIADPTKAPEMRMMGVGLLILDLDPLTRPEAMLVESVESNIVKTVESNIVEGAETAAAKGPSATLDLAMQVQGNVPLGAQTITLLETAEGPTLVAGGETDLSAAQLARAQGLGLTPADPLPGFHAEQTAISHAGQNGLTPTFGVTTNGVCAGRCTPLIVEELGGWVDGNTYGFGPR